MRVRQVRTRQHMQDALNLAREVGGQEFVWPTANSQALWVALDKRGRVVGMAGATINEHREAHLTICAVAPRARGQGLQRRLIVARLEWAKRQGAREAYTYANRHNLASIANLVRLGFSPYRVDSAQHFVYFGRYLSKPISRAA